MLDQRIAQEDYTSIACNSRGLIEHGFNYRVRLAIAKLGHIVTSANSVSMAKKAGVLPIAGNREAEHLMIVPGGMSDVRDGELRDGREQSACHFHGPVENSLAPVGLPLHAMAQARAPPQAAFAW